jgi:hypothetical protein
MTEQEIEHLESVAHVLGRTHGAISNILNMPIDLVRPSLQALFDQMNEDIIKLYYPIRPESI